MKGQHFFGQLSKQHFVDPGFAMISGIQLDWGTPVASGPAVGYKTP